MVSANFDALVFTKNYYVTIIDNNEPIRKPKMAFLSIEKNFSRDLIEIIRKYDVDELTVLNHKFLKKENFETLRRFDKRITIIYK